MDHPVPDDPSLMGLVIGPSATDQGSWSIAVQRWAVFLRPYQFNANSSVYESTLSIENVNVPNSRIVYIKFSFRFALSQACDG